LVSKAHSVIIRTQPSCLRLFSCSPVIELDNVIMFNYLKTMMGVFLILLNGIFIHRPQQRFVSGVEVSTNSQQFTQFTQFKCDNIPVCANSQPSKSFSVTSKAQCVLYCQQRRQQPESCVGVNYKDQKSTCEIFNYEVYRFKKNVTGCRYIQVRINVLSSRL
jgi:hypothetical protein